MAISHAGHDHASTPAARARCRKGLNPTPASNAPAATSTTRATPHFITKEEEQEERPAEKSRCCYNCKVRKIEWKGRVYLSNMLILVCEKCKYILDPDHEITYKEV